MTSVDIGNPLHERIVTLKVTGLKRSMMRIRFGLWVMTLALIIIGFGKVDVITTPDDGTEGVGG